MPATSPLSVSPIAAPDLQPRWHASPLALSSRLSLALLAIWALAMIVPSLIQVVTPLAAFGLSSDNNGVLLDVVAPFGQPAESPAARAGLVPGDRIDLHHAQCIAPASAECASIVPVLGGLGGLQFVWPDREIALPIIPADGGPSRIVSLRAAPAPLSWPTRVVLLADTVVGILFILTAFRLVWLRPGPMTWGFFVYALWFNPGQTYAFYAILQTSPPTIVAEQFAECLLLGASYAGLLAFALRFPNGTVEYRWRRMDRSVPFVGAVLASLTIASSANLFGFGTETITRVGLFSGFAVDAAAVLLLLLRRRHLNPLDEQRMRWGIAGFAIGVPAFILAAVCQSSGFLQEVLSTSPSQVVIGLLYLLNGVLAYFVAVAVQRRRVVSVAIPLRHGTIVFLLTLALGIPVLWLHEVLGEYQDHLQLPPWIWPFVVGPLVLVLLTRLHEIAVELTDQIFNRRFHLAKHGLNHAAHAMLEARAFGEVDRSLTQEPVQALRLSSGAVFRRVGGKYRRTEYTIGWQNATLTALRPDVDVLVLRCVALMAPVRLPRGTWNEHDFPQEEQGPCLAIPVVGGAKEAVAIALFGPHETGSDINSDECQMLQDLASRAAIAYDRVETEILRAEVSRLRTRLAEATPPLASEFP